VQSSAHAHQCIAGAALLITFAVRNFAVTVRCSASTDHYSSTPEPCSALLCLRLALRCNAAAVPSVPVRLQRYATPCLALSVQRTAFPQRGTALQCLRNANLIQSTSVHSLCDADHFRSSSSPCHLTASLNHHLCSISSHVKRPLPAFLHCPRPLYCP
jgi:hypothetical protein